MQDYQWAVIGAGPAGITTVGKLLDAGIQAEQILWLDPEFKVGDLGKYWSCVPSNTIVARLVKFLSACDAFAISKAKQKFPIFQADPKQTTLLANIVAPLQWITEQLSQQVNVVKDFVEHLQLHDRIWHLKTKTQTYHACNVVLATGALPKKLNFPETKEIELATALNKEKFSTSLC